MELSLIAVCRNRRRSQGGMIRLETLIELKFLDSSFFFGVLLVLKSDKQSSIEQFEPTVSQSTVSSLPPRRLHA